MDLAERVAWAIAKIKEDTELPWTKLGKKLGTNKDTIALYAKAQGEKILGNVIERISVDYKISSVWLLEGKGEPFPNAREKYPEVCGPENGDVIPLYKDRRQEPPRGQDDYATKAARVLQLKSPAAEAIRRAIDELDREITPKMEIAALREKNEELQETIGDLEDRLAALEEKLDRALGGNCEEKKHQATA